MNGAAARDTWVRWAALATLPLLLAHAALLRFLCDDAFISFRYAHNLAAGHGLVFNPGFERVEGFTDPLWVLLLAAFDLMGARPELAATVLGLALTVVLWWLTARASFAWRPPDAPAWIALAPVVWLAATRTVAVWSTGGLETRLFEVLVFGGVLALAADVEALTRGATGRRPWAALLLGLAAWTRPDGLLVGASVLAAAAAWLVIRRSWRWREGLAHGAAFGAVVGLQFALRLAYYGSWLPNTYYAKVDGRTWWTMGARYVAAFGLEYAAWLWIPLVAAGAASFARARRGDVPLLFAAAVLPHAAYVASIGGDHFEYRPLDLYVPFAFVLMARGLAALAKHPRRTAPAAAYAALVTVGLVVIPWAAHREFPSRYIAGFPGLAAGTLDAAEYLGPAGDPLLRLPGARAIAREHRALTRTLTRRFVAIRREEHVLFRESVEREGRRLRELVEGGTLPPDASIAIGSVGVIPYVSGLRTFDRFGLTDAEVARLAVGSVRVMAHEKIATIEMARAKGIDLWSVDPVHLLFREDDPVLLERIAESRGRGDDAVFGDVGAGWWLLARAPGGVEALRARLPRVALEPVSDDAAVERLGRTVVDAAGRTPDGRARRARALDLCGRADEADAAWRELAAAGDGEALLRVARIELGAARPAEALAALDRLLAGRPDAAPAWSLRGIVLAREGRAADAVASLRRAVDIEPDDDDARYALGVSCILAGLPAEAEEQREALEPRRPDLAEKLRGAAGAAMTGRWPIAGALLVMALAVGIYVPGLPGDFVYDDFRLIVRNEGLKRPFDPGRAFLRDYYASDFDRMGLGYYRPIAILSNEIDYRRGGGRPLPFHATNIAVHAICTALTMLLARRLSGGSVPIALGAGVLFALHPAHAESVAFISGRVDPLATMFALAALLAHARAQDAGASRAWTAWAGVAWLGALLSKEMAVTVPLAAAILDSARDGIAPWRRGARELARRYAPFAAAAGVYLAMRWVALGALAPVPAGDAVWSALRPVTTVGSYVAWLVLPPYGLHLEPGIPSGPWAVLAAAAGALAVAAAIALWRRGERVHGALIGCALVALVPVSQLRVLETALSERFLYLPSVFGSILVASALLRARHARWGRWVLAALAAAYVAVLAHRAALWRDEVRLWAAQTEEQPESVRAWVNLAHAHARRGDRDAARAVYARAGQLGLDPKVLAAEMASVAGPEDAADEERVLLDALEVVPGDAAIWQNLGFVRLGKGDADGACEAFERAVALVPTRSTGWLGLAFGELRRRRWAEALAAAERAVTLDPGLAIARAVRGECLWRLGQPCEAVRALEGLELTEADEAAAARRVLEAARADCGGAGK